MTDNEIINALKLCTSEHMGCEDGCPLGHNGLTYAKCLKNLPKITLDLINRQRAEIERLNKEVDRLSQCVMYHDGHIADAQSEAYREFAKYLTKHIKDELEQCGNPNHDTQPIAYGTVLGLKSALSFVETAPIFLESDVPDQTATNHSVSLIDGHIEE